MKAILVIDTPKECYYCKLMTNDMYCKGFAPYYAKDGTRITKMCVEDYVMLGTKHPNCPLKPVHSLKSGGRDYIIYERQFLYDNLDREIEMIKKGKEINENNIKKES